MRVAGIIPSGSRGPTTPLRRNKSTAALDECRGNNRARGEDHRRRLAPSHSSVARIAASRLSRRPFSRPRSSREIVDWFTPACFARWRCVMPAVRRPSYTSWPISSRPRNVVASALLNPRDRVSTAIPDHRPVDWRQTIAHPPINYSRDAHQGWGSIFLRERGAGSPGRHVALGIGARTSAAVGGGRWAVVLGWSVAECNQRSLVIASGR